MKLDRITAADILSRIEATAETDFHKLSSGQVGIVLTFADKHNYRKPRGANGSRGRYFFAYVQRAARRKP